MHPGCSQKTEVSHLHSESLTGLYCLGKLTHRLLASATIRPSRFSSSQGGCIMTAAGGLYTIVRRQSADS